MPLVFIHGVNVREGTTPKKKREFADAVDARNRLFRSIGLAGLVPSPGALHIENPYWGAHGVTFSHDLASVPGSGTEKFGLSPDDLPSRVLTETLPPSVAEKAVKTPGAETALLLTLAREDPKRSLALAIDAVVATAAQSGVEGDPDVGKENDALASFAAAATKYLRSAPDTAWLFAAHPRTGQPLLQDDNQFLEALVVRIKPFASPADGPEIFGGLKLLDRLKIAGLALGQAARTTSRAVATVARGVVGAATGAVGAAVSASAGAAIGAAAGGAPGALLRLLRPGATQRVGLFVGDVFKYLDLRGDTKAPGDVVKVVCDALRRAADAKSPHDSKLVVVAHSMGGNIVYDIVTHFDPTIAIDMLVTVGSQVALFKEMSLYLEDKTVPVKAGKWPRPASVAAWLNVFDPLDVLAFAAGGVFNSVTDYAFSTQASILDAHSTYFYRPTFHERLRVRMFEAGLGVAP
jgi:hypothetical protein